MDGWGFRTGSMAQMHSLSRANDDKNWKRFEISYHFSDSEIHSKRHVRLHTIQSAREMFPDEKKKY